jgi:hypothetical protein
MQKCEEPSDRPQPRHAAPRTIVRDTREALSGKVLNRRMQTVQSPEV